MENFKSIGVRVVPICKKKNKTYTNTKQSNATDTDPSFKYPVIQKLV